jgi:hypothetical protein
MLARFLGDTAGVRKLDDPVGVTVDGIIPFRRVGRRKTRNQSPPHLYLLYRASKATQREGSGSV